MESPTIFLSHAIQHLLENSPLLIYELKAELIHLYKWGNNQLLLMNNYLACIAVVVWGKGAWDVRKNQK